MIHRRPVCLASGILWTVFRLMRLFLLVATVLPFGLPLRAAEATKITMTWDHEERTAWLYQPPAADGPARLHPLVIALHGAGGDPIGFALTTGLTGLVDRDAAAVVFPEGLSVPERQGWRAWNAVFCCGPVARMRVDDQGFILALIDRLVADHAIDPQRVYITGLSNGGMLAYRLAVLAPQKISAIAVVAGTIGGTAGLGALPISLAAPAKPVPVLVIHGRKDPFILYDGGISRRLGIPGRFTISVEDSLRFWRKADQCAPSPTVTHEADGQVEDALWARCAEGAAVELLALRDIEHQWPDLLPDAMGNPVPAYTRVWDFMRHYRR